MTTWIPCGDGFIEADVVRWTEVVWKRGRRKNSRAVKTGARAVTAQVESIDAQGWVVLHVLESIVTEETQGRRVTEVLKKGQKLRRKRGSIARGKAERLRWSDESARAVLVSRFLADSADEEARN